MTALVLNPNIQIDFGAKIQNSDARKVLILSVLKKCWRCWGHWLRVMARSWIFSRVLARCFLNYRGCWTRHDIWPFFQGVSTVLLRGCHREGQCLNSYAWKNIFIYSSVTCWVPRNTAQDALVSISDCKCMIRGVFRNSPIVGFMVLNRISLLTYGQALIGKLCHGIIFLIRTSIFFRTGFLIFRWQISQIIPWTLFLLIRLECFSILRECPISTGIRGRAERIQGHDFFRPV